MKHIQFVVFITILLLHSCVSFSPPSWHRRAAANKVLHYSDVAERIALNTEQNSQVFSNTDYKPQHAREWQSLVPLLPNDIGCDVSIVWSSPQQGAQTLLQHLFPSNPTRQALLYSQVYGALQSFASLFGSSNNKFKTRVVATRGNKGTKCPRWHVDHVPARWIQALVGPGCDYIEGSDGIQWECINGMEFVDSQQANLELVDELQAKVVHAQQGDGIVLYGAENTRGCFPAVHKSPTLGPFQGRVVMTIDVVRDEHDNHE